MKKLIKKAQEGDDEAFKELSINYSNDLYRVAKSRLYDEDDINDAIQNTLLLIYKNINKIQNIDYFRTWMIHILINECNKIYNSNKKNNEIYNKVIYDYSYTEKEIDNSIYQIDDKLNFESLLDKLNYEEKIVITLYYNNQYSCKQISEILDTNINTIKSRLIRGKNKLQDLYKGGIE